MRVEAYRLGMITGWGRTCMILSNRPWEMTISDGKRRPAGTFRCGILPDLHVGIEGDTVCDDGVIMTSHDGGPGVKFVTEGALARCALGKMDCCQRRLRRRQTPDLEVMLKTRRNHMEDFLHVHS